MRIFCIGDVCGSIGCDAVRRLLPPFKKLKGIDLVIANGENSADGNGILPSSAEHLFTSGVDVITGGNHTLRRREIYEMLSSNEFMLRPANLPENVFGSGYTIVDCGYTQVAIINLLGVVYMESMSCPFRTAESLIKRAKSDGAKIILIDFHAEATSEKRALGFAFDGSVSGVFGTHTHVQTADAQVLPNGTGYITDLGMTGVTQSVLGVKPENIIQKLRDKMPVRFEGAEGEATLCGALFTIDNNTGKATSVEGVQLI